MKYVQHVKNVLCYEQKVLHIGAALTRTLTTETSGMENIDNRSRIIKALVKITVVE